METSEVLLALQKPRLYELAAAGARIDGRKPDEYRQITIDENFIAFTAEGSCRLRMGNTDLIAGVKLTTGTPFPDTPEEGVLMTGAELPPLASSEFSFGPPSPFAIETARVIDRGIRESKMLDVKKLVIEPKESVWIVNIDIQALNYDGNLIDAGQLAAVKALLSTKIPKYEDGKIIREESSGNLPTQDKPISTTFAQVNKHNFLDPKFEEERLADALLTIQSTEKGALCAMQKQGTGSFMPKEVEGLVEESIKKGKEIRKKFL
ncbi:MAG: exosome complex protein Rrp42 [DPANN group archaeon]|nr:exosome complex protein Rrp42 [DPANN group archaeon]